MPATYDKITSTTLSTSASDVTFSSIPGTYTDLVLVMEGYATTTDGLGQSYRLNGDNNNNYSHTNVYGNGTNSYSNRTSSQTVAFISYGLGWSTTSTNRSLIKIDFQNYSNTTTYKTAIARANSAGGSYPGTEMLVSLWRNTAAITSITILPYSTAKLATGTTLTLYGIKAA